jgi:hypothetical protein
MRAPLPPKKILIPMHLNPASRYVRGGREDCPHHYAEDSKRIFLRTVEWVCANCDRICGFYKFEQYDGQPQEHQ